MRHISDNRKTFVLRYPTCVGCSPEDTWKYRVVNVKGDARYTGREIEEPSEDVIGGKVHTAFMFYKTEPQGKAKVYVEMKNKKGKKKTKKVVHKW